MSPANPYSFGVAMKHFIFDVACTQSLYNNLRRANTESAKKELFLNYISTIYQSDKDAQAIIQDLAHGAEKMIANIPKGGRNARGRADTQTNTLIIEWE